MRFLLDITRYYITILSIRHTVPGMEENVDPFADVVDKVGSAARGALAAHVDGSSKDLNKRNRGPRMSDAAKIESLNASADGVEALFALVDNVRQCLSSVANGGNASLSLPIDTLQFIASAGRQQLSDIRAAMNNTSAKRQAALAHSKLSKVERQRINDQQLQRQVLATTNPRKMLQMAIANTKQKLDVRRQPIVSDGESDVADDIAPRTKRHKLDAA